MARDEKLITEIALAMESNDVERFEQLLRSHLECLRENLGNKTWLHCAAQGAHLEIVKLLVRLGLSVNEPRPTDPSDEPEGPVYSAVIGAADERRSSTEVVKWLLENGAQSNCVVDGVVRNFALSSAARNGRLDLVKLLVEYGADVNATWAGMNALSNSMGHKEVEEYLRSKGAVEPWRALGDKLESPGNEILRYAKKQLGKVQELSLQAIVPSEPNISIHVVPPSKKHNRIALFTTGMSDLPMTIPPGGQAYQFAELVMYLPSDWPLTDKALKKPENFWPIEWLRKIALYPHQNGTWLGGKVAIIDNGDPPEPFAPNTKMSCMLLLSEFGELQRTNLLDMRSICFYTLIPIYVEERDFERERGVEALIQLFKDHKIPRELNVTRPNVAKKGKK